MYPVTFPREQWYVAGHAEDIDRTLMSRWILGDPICFYRTLDGRPVALTDRCVHRQMPLSMGRLKADDVECGYHGILYGQDGQAIHIPAQTTVPPGCRVRRYPLVERAGLIWIWMGDAEAVDESSIPETPWLEDPCWTTVRGNLHMEARAQLMNENLLDLSHVTFLHPESLGTEEVAETPVSVDFDDRSVRVTRMMSDIKSPPLFEKVMGLMGRIDREQVAEFIAPSLHITHVMAKPTGVEMSSPEVCRHKAVHCITPARAGSAHYFWALARDYRIHDDEVSELWAKGNPMVFGQDITAVEAIERMLVASEPEEPETVNIRIDGGPLRARRIIERMVAAEASADMASAGSRK